MGAVRDHSILIACIGAGSAVFAAFAKPICDAVFGSGDKPPVAASSADPAMGSSTLNTPVTPTATAAMAPIEGAWKQFILDADGDMYLGTFVVARSKLGEYVISPRNQVGGDDVQNSVGVFDVSYDGQTWSYNSKWADEEVGNYELKRTSPTEFEGEIRVAGKLLNRTKVVKIE